MTTRLVERDERTIAIDHLSYRWAYVVLSFGVLLIIAFRWFLGETMPWEFLALVVVSGSVKMAIQAWHEALYRRWFLLGVAALVAGTAIARLIVYLRH